LAIRNVSKEHLQEVLDKYARRGSHEKKFENDVEEREEEDSAGRVRRVSNDGGVVGGHYVTKVDNIDEYDYYDIGANSYDIGVYM
jgi:hypothetical protein